MSEGQPIIEIEGLTKDFRPGFGLRRKRVLEGIALEVHKGEIFGFIGPNGAGKTTTLKILMGLIRPTGGCARILGHDVSEVAFRRHVGFLPEGPYFYDFLTGRETLEFYSRLCGLSPARARARTQELLEQIGLGHAGGQRLRTYSKGMLQRIGIAQALVHDPEVLFLDEPMSGLDPVGRKEIRDLILHLHEEGKTIFMNTHILSDVEMICDRIAIIVGGRIVHQASAQELRAADGGLVDIIAMGLSAGLAERLETEHGAELRGRGGRIEVRVASKRVDQVLGEIVADGAHVLSAMPLRGGLEDLFMAAIGEGER